MSTTATTTFEVSNVKLATEPLPEVPYKQAVEALLTTGILPHERQFHRKVEEPGSVDTHSRTASVTSGRSLLQIPRAAPCRCLVPPGRRRRSSCLHGSPPSMPLARHDLANDHPGSRQSHQRQRRGTTTEDCQPSRESSQSKCGETISSKAPPRIRGRRSSTNSRRRSGIMSGRASSSSYPAFSTTGPVERAAAEVVLLDAMQSYFEYQVHTRLRHPHDHPGGDTRGLEGVSPSECRASGSSDWDRGLRSWHQSSINLQGRPKAMLTRHSGGHSTKSMARAAVQ